MGSAAATVIRIGRALLRTYLVAGPGAGGSSAGAAPTPIRAEAPASSRAGVLLDATPYGDASAVDSPQRQRPLSQPSGSTSASCTCGTAGTCRWGASTAHTLTCAAIAPVCSAAYSTQPVLRVL